MRPLLINFEIFYDYYIFNSDLKILMENIIILDKINIRYIYLSHSECIKTSIKILIVILYIYINIFFSSLRFFSCHCFF